MSITAKPADYTVNTGHAKCPQHLWMLDEGSGTTLADQGSGTALNMTLDNADMWGTDGSLGAIVTANKSGPRKAVSATGTLPSTSLLMVVIVKTINDDGYVGASNEYLCGAGYESNSLQTYFNIRAQPQFDNKVDGAIRDGTSAVSHNTTGLSFYDQTWRMLAMKVKTNGLALSVDGSAWSEITNAYTYPNSAGNAPNRFALGSDATSSASSPTEASFLAMATWANDYTAWNDAWIANLFADPWQFLDTTAGSPLILPHRSGGGMLDLSGNFRG